MRTSGKEQDTAFCQAFLEEKVALMSGDTTLQMTTERLEGFENCPMLFDETQWP